LDAFNTSLFISIYSEKITPEQFAVIGSENNRKILTKSAVGSYAM
jgi:hypothetical protein